MLSFSSLMLSVINQLKLMVEWMLCLEMYVSQRQLVEWYQGGIIVLYGNAHPCVACSVQDMRWYALQGVRSSSYSLIINIIMLQFLIQCYTPNKQN